MILTMQKNRNIQALATVLNWPFNKERTTVYANSTTQDYI
jgi:hypothetical protein